MGLEGCVPSPPFTQSVCVRKRLVHSGCRGIYLDFVTECSHESSLPLMALTCSPFLSDWPQKFDTGGRSSQMLGIVHCQAHERWNSEGGT